MSGFCYWGTCQVDGVLLAWHVWDQETFEPVRTDQFPGIRITADQPLRIASVSLGESACVTALVLGDDGISYAIAFNRGEPPSKRAQQAHGHLGDERCADCCDHLCLNCKRRAGFGAIQICAHCLCGRSGCAGTVMPGSDFCGKHQR